ncbi:DNA-directed RNA polymerase II subunit RPB7 [Dendrobium catenatum]|uniref:DNA-directed RNA polymerase subunit n=1 Tax=Dendrobium catenatum TaxID=906689 RepID=A0A2I0VXE2_9ASPA|nr:DNA-directed RNA polymerase II subunit RPB7 [Dendrobium catenatum]
MILSQSFSCLSSYLHLIIPWSSILQVVIPFSMLTFASLPSRKVILLNLLKQIYGRKASENHGHYIAVMNLNAISELQINEVTGDAFVPVYFNCATVKPYIGEILIGTVTTILESGIFLKSGPMDNIYLSKTMMGGYENSLSEEPMFLKMNGLSYMKKGTKVRFRVFDIKWIKSLKVFNVTATILGDYLGPL